MTHQSGISENLTAGPRGPDGKIKWDLACKGRDVGIFDTSAVTRCLRRPECAVRITDRGLPHESAGGQNKG